MKIKNCFFLFFLLTLTWACQKSPKDIEGSFLKSTFDKHLKIDADTKWVVILPGLGCHGCIQDVEVFMKNHLNRKDIKFVLTNTSSLKILQQKLEIKLADFPDIFVDKDNLFLVPTDNKIYPCIVKLEKGKIVSHEFQCPQNSNALFKLQKLLSTL